MKDRINQKLQSAGWNWMSSAEKYIRVGSDITEKRYWVAPFAPGDHAVEERRAQSFRSLKELEEFLNERM